MSFNSYLTIPPKFSILFKFDLFISNIFTLFFNNNLSQSGAPIFPKPINPILYMIISHLVILLF